MADDLPPRLLLIVTGSTLRAEELDRPLAYYLQQQVDRASGRLDLAIETRVVADFRWMNDDELQVAPTISVGGPGVNALAHSWFEEVPFSLAVDEQYCIQMDPDLAEPGPASGGWTTPRPRSPSRSSSTATCPRFLEQAANHAPDLVDPDRSPTTERLTGPGGGLRPGDPCRDTMLADFGVSRGNRPREVPNVSAWTDPELVARRDLLLETLRGYGRLAVAYSGGRRQRGRGQGRPGRPGRLGHRRHGGLGEPRARRARGGHRSWPGGSGSPTG